MPTGTVKNFDTKRGFGFLSNDEGGSDVFCHWTAIQADGYKKLEAGQRVQFGIGSFVEPGSSWMTRG